MDKLTPRQTERARLYWLSPTEIDLLEEIKEWSRDPMNRSIEDGGLR